MSRLQKRKGSSLMYDSPVKKFKPFDDKIPCYECIVLAACKGKNKLECEILLNFYQECIAKGVNTLLVHNDLVELFPNTASFNGTIILA